MNGCTMHVLKLTRITGIILSTIGVLFILFGGIKTPENFRILSDFIQNFLLIIIVLLLFLPDDRKMKVSFLVGLFSTGFDFILESAAVYSNWWFPLGGTQFPPAIVVPLEMVCSFFIIGTNTSIMFYLPEKIRMMDCKPFDWLKKFVRNKRYDVHWRVVFLFANAVIGMNGDYSSGPAIWMPGASWFPVYTFLVWFLGGLLILAFFTVVDRKLAR